MLLPLPLAPMPMFVLLFAQVYVVPDTFDEKLMAAVRKVLHIVCPVGVTVSIGVGFTCTENTCTGPKQLFAVGVTVNTPLTTALPVLVAVKDAMALPLPLAPIPIVVLLLAHV
jgi:hypothetical protein